MIDEGKNTSGMSSNKDHFDATNPNNYFHTTAERTVLLNDPFRDTKQKTSKAKKAAQATKEKLVKINSFFNNPKAGGKLNPALTGTSLQRNRLFLEGGNSEMLEGGGSESKQFANNNEPDFVS